MRVRRLLLGVGLVGVLTGVALLLWPLDATGVTGSALRPHFHDLGWVTAHPMPVHPSRQQLRAAGIAVPQDAVHRRRAVSGAAFGVGVVGAAAWWSARRRGRLRLGAPDEDAAGRQGSG